MDINRIKAVGFGVTYPMGNFKELSFTRRPLTSTDILIDVLYAGICHSDIHMARGDIYVEKNGGKLNYLNCFK